MVVQWWLTKNALAALCYEYHTFLRNVLTAEVQGR
jgi:hypothetical protein